jgi:hypothetical protein
MLPLCIRDKVAVQIKLLLIDIYLYTNFQNFMRLSYVCTFNKLGQLDWAIILGHAYGREDNYEHSLEAQNSE